MATCPSSSLERGVTRTTGLYCLDKANRRKTFRAAPVDKGRRFGGQKLNEKHLNLDMKVFITLLMLDSLLPHSILHWILYYRYFLVFQYFDCLMVYIPYKSPTFLSSCSLNIAIKKPLCIHFLWLGFFFHYDYTLHWDHYRYLILIML